MFVRWCTDRATSLSDRLKWNVRGGKSMTRWVWCIGIFALIVTVGGCAAGWYFTHGSPSHTIPVAIGGAGTETMAGTTTWTLPTPVGTTKPAAASARRTPESKRAESAAIKMEKRIGTLRHHNAHQRHHIGEFVVPKAPKRLYQTLQIRQYGRSSSPRAALPL